MYDRFWIFSTPLAPAPELKMTDGQKPLPPKNMAELPRTQEPNEARHALVLVSAREGEVVLLRDVLVTDGGLHQSGEFFAIAHRDLVAGELVVLVAQ